MVATWRSVPVIGRPLGPAIPNQRIRAAAAALLLTLASFGCSTSPDDESSPAIEEPASTTVAAQRVDEAQPQTEPSEPEPSPMTSAAATTTTPPTTTAPPTTTTQPATPAKPEAGDGEGVDASSEDHEEPTGDNEPSDDPIEQTAPCDGTDPPEQVFAPRLISWGDGLLEVGYPASASEWDRTRLAVRSTADGLAWSAIKTCPFPFADVPVSDTSEYPIASAASNGQRLVLTMPFEDRVLVSTTSNLSDWETFEVVPTEPDGLPHGVRADTGADQLAISSHGWLLSTSTWLGVDLWVLAPADIRDSAQYIRFGYPESQGLIVEWETEQQAPDEPYHSRFVTWEELGIDEDTYSEFGIAEFANKPYTPTWLRSFDSWSAGWNQEPVRAGLPEVSQANFWRIVGTDAGYVGLPWIGEPGYPPAVGVDEMFFSRDGTAWDRIDTPGGTGVTLMSLAAVENGVLVVGDVSDEAYNPIGWQLWLADATGADWRPVELPGLPERSWIDIYGRGHGVVGRSGLTEGDWRAQWIVGSTNGVDWLVMEHSAPRWELQMTIIDDAMLVTDREGTTQRFPIP